MRKQKIKISELEAAFWAMLIVLVSIIAIYCGKHGKIFPMLILSVVAILGTIQLVQDCKQDGIQ